MFSESLRKKIARFLVYVMLFCNMSPAFAMMAAPNYQPNVQQYAHPMLHHIVAQMMAGAAKQPVFPESQTFDVSDLGRVHIDETGSLVLDANTLLDPTKAISFTTKRNVILDSLICDCIKITAPNITVRGNALIRSLDLSLSEENGVFAIDHKSTLSTEEATIDGMIYNYGTLHFTGNLGLRSNESVLFNMGTINGDLFTLENIGTVINQGTIFGQSIGLQSNVLQNDGTIGGTESALDLMVHKSLINNNEIFGKSAKVVLTSDDRGFSNKGSIDITDAELQVSGYFKNEGESTFGKLTGFVSKLFNKGKLKSKYGSLSINTGENQHILKLSSLISNGDFLNTFTDQYSAMRVESILGSGKFFNRSAFKMLGVGVFGIREFYNQNAEFVKQYGCSSFGNAVRFMSSLGKLVNEGSMVADRLRFEDTDAVVTNIAAAVIKTSREMTGKVRSVDNLGGLFSEHSFISLMFDTFVHRGELQADKGVSFTGRILRNYVDLSLHSSRINRIFNGESITDNIDDIFFAGMDKAITTIASDIAAMPLDQRREAIADILQKAKTMNMLQEEIAKLQAYFDVLNAVVPPTYAPIYHVEDYTQWSHRWGYNCYLIATDPIAKTEISRQHCAIDGQSHSNQFQADVVEKTRAATTRNTELEADYKRKSEALEAAPFPMAELSKLISVYSKHSIPKTSANLWMFFGSNIGRLENTGYVEFIKGLHSIDTYMGTAESEFLVSKADILPDYTDVLRDIAEPSVEQELIQYGGETTEDGSYSEFYSVSGYEKTAESFLSIPDLDARRQAMQLFLRTVSSQTPDVVEAIDNINAYLAQLPPSNYWLVFSAASNPYSISGGWEHWDGYTTKFVRQFRDPLDFGGHYTVNDNYATTHPSFGDFVRAKKQELTDRINRPLPDIKADFVRLIAQHHELSRGKTKKYHTVVTERKIEGAGKIQATKMRITDWNMTDRFSLLADELETVTPGFVNTKNIDLPGVKLVFDLLTQDFENTGSITSLGFLVKNCGIFRNKSKIETHADIDVEARQILNVGNPTVTPRSTASVPYDEFFYSHAWGQPGGKIYIKNIAWNAPRWGGGWWCTNRVSNPVNFDFYSPGSAVLKSHAGKVKLNGSELIQNESSSISAAHGFTLKSLGAITNRIGNISSNGTEPSIIDAASFIHACGDTQDISVGWGTRHCEPHFWFHISPNPFFGTFDTSTKPEIYTGGDLNITTTQFPTIKGADIFSGGTVRFDFQTGTFNAEQVHNNVPTMAVHDNILINGQDIGLKGARFVAGMGIGMTATGKVAIINPSGNQIILPPTGAIDINVSELAKKSYGHMLMAPQSKFSIAPHMILDPTAGMKKLFFGRMPDPTKRLVFDTRVMSVLPMILAKYETLLGTRVLNMPQFLTSLDENAQKLNGAIIPANQMPNELLMYFTVEDGDEDGEEKAYLHFNIPVEELGKTLSKTFEIRSERDLLSIRGSEIDLENTSLSGASVEIVAKKDSTFSGKVSMVASEITATEDKVHIHGDNGVDTKGRFDKTMHYYSIDGGHAGFETATHAPMLISAPKEVILSGGVSEIRGTIVKTKTFKDETERLLIGVDKTALRYWSHAEKESGGILGGSSSMERHGSQEIAHPSILEVEEMFSRSGQSLIFESVIAEGLQRLLVEKPIFHETVATLHSHDETKVESSGFSLFGLGGAPSIPQDPLIGAFASLSRAANSKALIAEAIKTAASICGSADDATKLFNAVTSGISLDTASIIAGTLAKRYLNLGISFGSTTTATTSHQTQQLPNKISAELIELQCPTAVHLHGHHEAREFIVETESFTTTDIVNTATIESKTEGNGGSFNPVSAVVGSFFPGMSVGVGTAFMGAVSGSGSDVTQTQRQTMHTPTTVVADKFMLRAGSAHLTDTQIKARLVDAIIRDDLVIESLTDEFFSEAKGGNFGLGLGFLSLVSGIQNMTDAARVTAGMGGGVVDVKEIERKVNKFAEIVGEEDFVLKVGGTLLARSAFYGQKDAGQTVTAPRMDATPVNPREHIEVGKAVHETVQEEHTKNDGSYSIPIGDAVNVAMSTSQFLDWLSQPSEKEKIRGEVYKKAITDGKTHEEARKEADVAGKAAEEFLEKEDVSDDYQKLKQAQLKQKQAKQTMEMLEAENPSLRDVAPEAKTVVKQPQSSKVDLVKLFEYRKAKEVQNSAAREAFNIVTSIREKAEAFAIAYPKFAEYGGYVLKGVGTAAIAGALISAAQVGLAAFLTTGASMVATDQAMAAVIETGTEHFVEYAASQGTTEAEARKFADTAVWTVEMIVTGAATVGLTKFIKNGGAVLTKLGTIRSNLGSIVKCTFQRTQSSVAKTDLTSAQGLFDAANKSPYNPRLMEFMLKSRYGEEVVTSTTMPRVNAKNVGLAGMRHEASGIVFDHRGFPIFDPYVKLETRITGDLGSMRPDVHMKMATKQLKADIEAGRVSRSMFSEIELTHIYAEKPKIGTFTWHHHQESGKMQLVPEDIHELVGHIGGNQLWGMPK